MYAPPKGSAYDDESLFDNIVAEVNMIQDLGGSILLTSDFNARTNGADDYVDCRYFAELGGVYLLCQWRLQPCGLYGRITCSV